ncbi:MAG: hypothetical protein J7K81_04745, partial [Methanophagales archaeon]|nr:hypothetical protein [Methanophagales archaeon]
MIEGGVAVAAEVGSEEVMVMLGMDREDESTRMQNTLRLAVCSDLRRNLLICLKEGKKALSELRVELEISSTTAIHALR